MAIFCDGSICAHSPHSFPPFFFVDSLLRRFIICKVLLPDERPVEVYANAWTGKKDGASEGAGIGFGAFGGAGKKGGFEGGGGGGCGGDGPATAQ